VGSPGGPLLKVFKGKIAHKGLKPLGGFIYIPLCQNIKGKYPCVKNTVKRDNNLKGGTPGKEHLFYLNGAL